MKSIKRILDYYSSIPIAQKNKLKSFFSMICSFCIATFKIVLGFIIMSFIWVYTGIYSLSIGTAKLLFYRCKSAKKGELPDKSIKVIAIILMVSAYLFNISIMIKQVYNHSTIEFPILIICFLSICFFFSFINAIYGIVQARKNKELKFTVYKIINISSALVNIVLLQRMILAYTNNISEDIIVIINSSFGYIVGVIILFLSILILLLYHNDKKKNSLE